MWLWIIGQIRVEVSWGKKPEVMNELWWRPSVPGVQMQTNWVWENETRSFLKFSFELSLYSSLFPSMYAKREKGSWKWNHFLRASEETLSWPECSQHRKSSLPMEVFSMPFFQPNVICKLAQPLGPNPVLKYLIWGLHLQSLNKIIMQSLCMSEVEGACIL